VNYEKKQNGFFMKHRVHGFLTHREGYDSPRNSDFTFYIFTFAPGNCILTLMTLWRIIRTAITVMHI